MAPTQAIGGEMMGTANGNEPTNKTSSSPWLIAAIVVASLLLVALAGYMVLGRFRDKHFEEARKRDPYLTRTDYQRRKKMTEMDRIEEQELQRSFMIRKSLATRSSRTNSEVTLTITTTDAHGARGSEDTEGPSLKDDWKQYEAQIQRERSASADRHPFCENLPLDVSEEPSPRSDASPASPGHSPLLGGHITPPLPSPPSFVHLNNERRTVIPRSAKPYPVPVYRP